LISSLRIPAKFFTIDWGRVIEGTTWTWNAYGADEKLHVAQRTEWIDPDHQRTVFTEHRYDALGRRILTRTRMDQYCDPAAQENACTWAIDRTIWDGDQILAELRNMAAHEVVLPLPDICVDGIDLERHPECGPNPPPSGLYAEDSTLIENPTSGGDFAGSVL